MGLLLVLGFTQDGNVTYLVAGMVVAIVAGTVAVWFMRGQGPTTSEVVTRLVGEERDARAKRRTANLWGSVAGVERLIRRRPAVPSSGESARAAQVRAVSDPETAVALQKLQNLLYTRAITDAEFAAAKAKLVGEVDDSYAQVQKLAELHRAGILGDVEFAAAKAKALGL